MKICIFASRLTLGVVLVMGSARLAAAQPPGAEDPRTQARNHVGPFYLTPALQLHNIGVDTNVFNTSVNPKSDFTFTVGPQADVWLPMGRRALLKMTGGADLVYFQTYSSERSINPHALVRGELYLQRLTLFAENDWLNTRQRPNYEIDARARRLENTIRLGGELRLSPKFSLELAGRQSLVKFDGDASFSGSYLEQALNRDSRGASANVRYHWTPLTTFAVRTDVSQERFVYSPLRDADTLRIQPGVEFKAPALIVGSAYVGMRRLVALHDELPNYHGMVASARLRFRLPASAVLEVSGDRDLAYSYDPHRPYFVVNGYGLSVRRRIVGRFDASVAGLRQRYSYRDLAMSDPTPTPPGVAREDATVVYSASLGYALNRETRMSFDVSRVHRSSTTEEHAAYEGFRFGTSVAYGF
jgi:hypothetical protein